MYNFKDFLNFSNNLQDNLNIRRRLSEAAEAQPLDQSMVASPVGEPGEQPGGGNAPGQTPPPPQEATPPKNPGDQVPPRKPNESDSEYQRRVEEYWKQKKAYDRYKEICPAMNCGNIWTYPNPRHPMERKGWQQGDFYIGPDGKLFQRNGQGGWDPYSYNVSQMGE
jgi:hypothetical protein